MRLRPFLRRIAADRQGSMLIETAVVAPTLIVLSIGAFEIATMVEKQNRLQSTAELATEIALVSAPDTDDERIAIQTELSSSLPATAAIQVEYKYRCGVTTTLEDAPPSGCSEEALSTYLHVALTDFYEPVWTSWGFGQAFEYDVQRTVQVS